MKKDDLLIDHEAESEDDKVGIVLKVEANDNYDYTLVDVLYPTGIYEVEVDDTSRWEVVSV